MKKKKHILVTGGAGFIGSNFVDRLLADEYQVSVFDNLSTGLRKNVPANVKFYKGDVSKIENLTDVFKNKFDAVLHIAGCASTINSFTNPLSDVHANFIGTINIVQKCIETKVPRLLYASSMTVYGYTEKLPIKETTVTRPISYYGITKYAAERFAHATSERKDLPSILNVTSFRMFNVYGERQSLTNPYQGVMAIFIGNVLRNEPITIFGDGKQSRDFIFIDDIIDVWVKSINNPKTFNNVFNLGCGKDISINNLVKQIIKTSGHDPKKYPIVYKPQRPGDQRHMRADITKIKKNLSWSPEYDLKRGLERTIAWARKEKQKTK